MQFAHFLLARALVASGQLESALDLVDRILAEIGATGGRWYEAEIHRLKGDVLRSQGKSFTEIESCYEAAIAVARRQGARVWELKALEALDSLRRAGADGSVRDDLPAQIAAVGDGATAMSRQTNAAPRPL
jgi:predicted ATPase